MNYIAKPNAARPFAVTRALLARIAAGMAAYGLIIVYPVYVALRLVWGPGTWGGFSELAWVAGGAALFGLYAFREMKKLTLVEKDAR